MRQKIELSYQSCRAMTDFMQRLAPYAACPTTRSKLADWLSGWSMQVSALEWRGLPEERVRQVATVVASFTFDSTVSIETLMDRRFLLIGGRIFDNDEERYSFLPLFDRQSPSFIGYTIYPDFYKRR